MDATMKHLGYTTIIRSSKPAPLTLVGRCLSAGQITRCSAAWRSLPALLLQSDDVNVLRANDSTLLAADGQPIIWHTDTLIY